MNTFETSDGQCKLSGRILVDLVSKFYLNRKKTDKARLTVQRTRIQRYRYFAFVERPEKIFKKSLHKGSSLRKMDWFLTRISTL